MILHENRLPADDSHEISCLIGYFKKKRQNLKLSSAANYRWHFRVNILARLCSVESVLRFISIHNLNTDFLLTIHIISIERHFPGTLLYK